MLRRTLAWSGGSSSLHRRGSAAFGSFAAKATTSTTMIPPTLLLRGGGNLFDRLPAILGKGKQRQSLSSSSSTTKLEASAAINSDIDTLNKEAKASLSIVGDSVQSASIEDISYLNTKDCNDFRVLFVLGGPGAGKGTQSDLMKENYACVHLSAGELLRAETTKEGSPHAELIESCIVAGKIVPVEISLSLLETAMRKAAAEHGTSLIFLVDGFPRNFDNLDGWIRCMKGVATVWGVLNYQCPLEELETRIMKRAEDSGRSDDNLQSARKRFATFERETVPVVDALRRVEDILQEQTQPALRVFDISGDQTVESVWIETQQAMNQMITHDVMTAQSQLFASIENKDAGLYRQLCADEWFGDSLPEEVFQKQEGGRDDGLGPISNVKLTFQSGTKVAIEYDRYLKDDLQVHEKRMWSHEGKSGWKNIHFARLPVKQ